MRVYSVHIRRHGLDLDRDFAVIKEGFCWPAFLFNAFWALWHRNWLAAVVMIAVLMAISYMNRFFGGTFITELILSTSWFMIIGGLANDIRRHQLDQKGFVDVGDTLAQSADMALYSYLRETLIKQ